MIAPSPSVRFWTIVLCVSVLQGCKQYAPPEPRGFDEPIFTARGVLNGATFAYAADGVAFEARSSYAIDDLGVYSYDGSLNNPACADLSCGPQLILNIRGTEDIDGDLTPGTYPVRLTALNKAPKLYQINLFPDAFGLNALAECRWVIDGVEYNTGIDGVTIYRTSDDPTFIQVLLEGTFDGGCVSSLEKTIYLPSHGCQTTIEQERLDAYHHLRYRALTTGIDAPKYAWQFGAGREASTAVVEYRYDDIPAIGYDQVMLTSGNDACVSSDARNVALKQDSVDCMINMTYSIITSTVHEHNPPQPDLGKCVLTYVDAQGRVFESGLRPQPAWSVVEVLDVQEFFDPLDPNADRSHAVKVKCDVRLYEASGDSTVVDSIDLREALLTLPLGMGL